MWIFQGLNKCLKNVMRDKKRRFCVINNGITLWPNYITK